MGNFSSFHIYLVRLEVLPSIIRLCCSGLLRNAYTIHFQVAELKKELADRGLSTKGNKGELQTRLQSKKQLMVTGRQRPVFQCLGSFRHPL